MAKVRVGRVGEQIKKEISQLIQYELKDPRVGFVTVTGVEVTGDLSQAIIYVSIMGSEEEVKDSQMALEKAKGFLRTEIGKRIRLRHTPELIFKIDESIAYGSKIEKLLKEIKETDQ
ncbi:ribosome-binding factor A [Vulcanibacillus modesticaldus]|uniref:Ribosome-binding factor A n=1 Tax=Vulcanibacillus modesticaldus TaxID=337097 RepID=A0A1D2YXK7_9BACI|nr:30S ribosome-binding factor RbfA [Vulcanibacillus modesticaldus]OEG00444.1 ribosome-binding factor A [Vulcanibacillus modesticaldus]